MSTPLLSRADLGLKPPKSTLTITAEGITLHWGGPALGWPYPHDRCPSIWRAWQDFHFSKGWADIAYSSGVCLHGYRLMGRGAGIRTAAQGTNEGNRRSLAVVILMGEGEPLTNEAKMGVLDERHRYSRTIAWLHQNWHSTACPGDPVEQWFHAGLPAPEVTPMFSPPLVLRPIVAELVGVPTGAWLLADDGDVYCWAGAANHGRPKGHQYWVGHKPALLIAEGDRYVVRDTQGNDYGPDFDAAP